MHTAQRGILARGTKFHGAASASWGLHDRLTGQLCDVITNTSRADHVPLMIRTVGSMAEDDNTCVNCTKLNRLK